MDIVKMSNQEIEKKFEFDLSLNIFERFNLIPFKNEVIFRCSYGTITLKFVILLEKLGFTLLSNIPDPRGRINYIGTYFENWVLILYKENGVRKANMMYRSKSPIITFNEIPDYIMEYDI